MKQIWSDHVLEFLQAHSLFAGAGFVQGQILTLLNRYEVEDLFVSKARRLHQRDDLQEGFYLLLRGRLFVSGHFDSKPMMREDDGEWHCTQLIRPGQCLGLPTFMATEDARWQMRVAVGDVTELLFFPRSAMVKRMMHSETLDVLDGRFWQQLLVAQSNEVKLLQKHLYFLQLKSIRAKLAAFLLDRAEECRVSRFTLPYSREELANYLNIARPSMSRELAALKQEGCIDFSLRSFSLLDKNALRSFLGHC